jgi:peptide/nickel transport system ATP-binding protein
MGISLPEKRIDDYPHQFSGGMRQRAMIAVAMACNPHILIADEATTALDVTIQAQIFELMLKLQQDYDTAILMITHDMGVVAELADDVAVMYMGEIVECGTVEEIFKETAHPYTKALLKSIPILGCGKNQELEPIRGSIPGFLSSIEGCLFADRCDYFTKECLQKPDDKFLTPTHVVKCWHYKDQKNEQ